MKTIEKLVTQVTMIIIRDPSETCPGHLQITINKTTFDPLLKMSWLQVIKKCVRICITTTIFKKCPSSSDCINLLKYSLFHVKLVSRRHMCLTWDHWSVSDFVVSSESILVQASIVQSSHCSICSKSCTNAQMWT